MKKLLLILVCLYFSGFAQNKELSNTFSKSSEKMQISSVFVEEATNATYYSLSQNYPNPFNPITKIKFSILRKENVSIKVFNVIGKEVFGKNEKEMEPGVYEYTFDLTNMPSGVYFYKLSTSNFINIKKMILIK